MSPPTRAPRMGRMRRMATYPLRLGPDEHPLPVTPFLRLAVMHACSAAGDALVTVALAGSVFVSVSLGAARDRTALGLVSTVLPFVVVGPFLGPRLDRVRGGRRAVVAASCVGRAGACVAMVHVIHSLWLFPAAFFSLVCSKTYLVAKASLVPGAVSSDDDLVTANSRLAIGSSVVTSLVAVAGAGIYRVFGSGAVLYLDAAIFSGGAILAVGVRPVRPPPLGLRVAAVASSVTSEPAGVPAAGLPQPGDAGRPSLPPGGLGAAAVAMASMRGMAGLMTALVVFAFRRDGAPLLWYGLVGVASVGGNLGGAALAPGLRAHVREDRLVPACAVAVGVLALALTQLAAMHRRPAALLLAAGVGFAASVAKLAFDALVQRQVPDARRSRRFAQYETTFQLAWVLAALVPVLVPLALEWGFVVVAVCTLGGAVAFWAVLARARAGTLPGWWPDAEGRASPVYPGRTGPIRSRVAPGDDFAGMSRPSPSGEAPGPVGEVPGPVGRPPTGRVDARPGPIRGGRRPGARKRPGRSPRDRR